jgi:hypothetical protein
MGAFEHVISLLSFVYALAIAHLLTTVARLIANRERVIFSWFHAFWMFNAMVVLILDWISFWDLHAVASWSMVSIGLCILDSFTDYMQAALVCPEIPAEGPIDLPAFHAHQSGRYIGAFAVTTVMALILNSYFSGAYDVAEFAQQNKAVLPLIAVAVTAAVWRNRWVQIVCPMLLTVIWVFYFTELQSALR